MSREQILNKIRCNKPAASSKTPLPKLTAHADRHTDYVALFKEMTAVAGGRVVEIASLAEAKEKLRECVPHATAAYCQISELEIATVNVEDMHSPHELASIDLMVGQGGVAVAENGAVWVADDDVTFRASWFIARHLVLLVDKQDIVPTMWHAYRKINIQRPGFGCFISGPSKTADIEQSLVIGAHGAKSLTIFLRC